MRSWLCWLGIVAACGSPPSTKGTALGEVIGRVEIDQDIPQPGCRVYVTGTPKAVTCDTAGQFDLHNIDPGHVELRVVADEMDSSVPSRNVTTASNAGFMYRLRLPAAATR